MLSVIIYCMSSQKNIQKKIIKRVTAIACVSGENESRKWANTGKLALLYQMQSIVSFTCV